jgi:hypothetical protein
MALILGLEGHVRELTPPEILMEKEGAFSIADPERFLGALILLGF